MKSKNIIIVENLKKSYNKVVAVDGISFEVKEGETFGMLGPNGAGKTSTLEMIEGLRKIDEGTATIDGINVSRKPDAVREIVGIQLQSASYFDNLSVCEILELFGKFYNRTVNLKSLIEKVHLEGKEKAYANQLSGGQKQRLSIASSLVNNPRYFFWTNLQRASIHKPVETFGTSSKTSKKPKILPSCLPLTTWRRQKNSATVLPLWMKVRLSHLILLTLLSNNSSSAGSNPKNYGSAQRLTMYS